MMLLNGELKAPMLQDMQQQVIDLSDEHKELLKKSSNRLDRHSVA